MTKSSRRRLGLPLELEGARTPEHGGALAPVRGLHNTPRGRADRWVAATVVPPTSWRAAHPHGLRLGLEGTKLPHHATPHHKRATLPPARPPACTHPCTRRHKAPARARTLPAPIHARAPAAAPAYAQKPRLPSPACKHTRERAHVHSDTSHARTLARMRAYSCSLTTHSSS